MDCSNCQTYFNYQLEISSSNQASIRVLSQTQTQTKLYTKLSHSMYLLNEWRLNDRQRMPYTAWRDASIRSYCIAFRVIYSFHTVFHCSSFVREFDSFCLFSLFISCVLLLVFSFISFISFISPFNLASHF